MTTVALHWEQLLSEIPLVLQYLKEIGEDIASFVGRHSIVCGLLSN
jgi:hypothetical protein